MRAILGFVLLAVITFSSATYAQSYEATFNQPGFSGNLTTTIEDKLIDLILLAKPGSNIHLAIYGFDRLPIAIALLQASKRGVKVGAMFDGDLKKDGKKSGTAIHALMNGYEPLGLPKLSCTTKECVKFCKTLLVGNSCRGFQNNHNKLIMLSELTNGQKNVVSVSSANWSDSQLKNYNDLLTLSDDPKLYDQALLYWRGLRNRTQKVPLVLKGDAAQIYTFPNFKNDPVLELLKRVSCQLPGSIVRVLQSRFTDHRKKIAEQLFELAHQGCDVSVIGRHEPEHDSPGKKVKAILSGLMGVLKYEVPDGENFSSVHSKIVLVKASIDGSATAKSVVLAGSHNLNGNSLKWNDELLAQVQSESLFKSYLDYWNGVHEDAVAADMFLP